MSNTAIVPKKDEPTALALPQDVKAAIDLVKSYDPDLAMRALAIVVSRPIDKPCPVHLAFAAAQRERERGQVLDRDFYISPEQNMLMDSARGVQRDVSAQSGEFVASYRPCTPEENAALGAQPGDITRACEIIALDAYHKVLKVQELELRVHGKVITTYKPIIGLGIIKEDERYEKKSVRHWDDATRRYVDHPRNQWREIKLQGGWTLEDKVMTRAYKKALRRIPGMAATADEVREDGEREGLDLDLPEGARLSREQMAKRVADKRTEAEWDALPRAEQERRAASTHAAYEQRRNQRDPFGDDVREIIEEDDPEPVIVFGTEPEPQPELFTDNEPEPYPEPVVETKPEPVAVCPVCGGAMWDNRDTPEHPKRNPKAPDFKCKDRNCEGVYWPGQWPPQDKPTDDQLAQLKVLSQQIWSTPEKRKLFPDFFVNNWPTVDTNGAKKITEYFAHLSGAQATAAIVMLKQTVDSMTK